MKLNVALTETELREFRDMCFYIYKSRIELAALIVNEVLMVHPILVFNPGSRSLDKVESVCTNVGAIQLNLEE